MSYVRATASQRSQVKAIGGQGALSLYAVGTWAKFEKYREAWDLLREASGCEAHFSQNQGEVGHPSEETGSEPEKIPAGPAVARMQGAMNSFRNYVEKGGR